MTHPAVHDAVTPEDQHGWESPGTIAAAFATYFCVGAGKLVVMTIATLGLYPIFWFNKNWNAEQENTGELFHPLLRAIFSPIFFWSFATRVKDRAAVIGVQSRFSPFLLAAAFVLLALAGRLPDPYWLAALLSALPLVAVQTALEGINAAHGIGPGPERRFTALNIVWIVFASLFFLLVAAALLLPAPEA